jgi:3-dehydroquinate dehydratase-1
MESLRKKLRRARYFRPELIELRLDYVDKLDIHKLSVIKKMLRGDEILTIRSSKEGGQNKISDNQRLILLHYTIATLKPYLVDIELLTIERFPFLLDELQRVKDTKLIVSYHDLGGHDDKVLEKRLHSAPIKHQSLFAIKIVSQANNAQDNLKLLGLYKDAKKGQVKSKLVAFCMGEKGTPSRILSLCLGSPYTYVSLPGETTAAGQLDISQMRRILKTQQRR